jgi:2-polyprenyl-6-methoxyphenol hydroxylase-like FAD-dependent oxidoreductase
VGAAVLTNVISVDSVIRVSPRFVDVVIVGGGLSGTLTAVLLGRSGLRVALIDVHQLYPPDFRAEQLVGAQVEMLCRMGLLDVLVRDVLPAERAVATRAGRTVGVVTAPHYGIRYDDLVNRARQHLPLSVQFMKAQVIDVDLTADIQWVRLSNGDLVGGRLVVLATGFGQRLLSKLVLAERRSGMSIRSPSDLILRLNLRRCFIQRCWWLTASRQQMALII